jgi:regulator of nucleoside diphosphate kinase
MRQRSNITISSTDHEQLLKLIHSARFDRRIDAQTLNDLEGELVRANIAAPHEMPRDVVSMNSTVWFRDLDSDEVESYTLVVPREADVDRLRISVLAPIGTALLGFRVGDQVEWPVPKGKRRLEITKVSQPRLSYQSELASMVF